MHLHSLCPTFTVREFSLGTLIYLNLSTIHVIHPSHISSAPTTTTFKFLVRDYDLYSTRHYIYFIFFTKPLYSYIYIQIGLLLKINECFELHNDHWDGRGYYAESSSLFEILSRLKYCSGSDTPQFQISLKTYLQTKWRRTRLLHGRKRRHKKRGSDFPSPYPGDLHPGPHSFSMQLRDVVVSLKDYSLFI